MDDDLCIPRGYSFQAHQSGIDEFNAALQNGVNLARNGDLKAAEEAFRHAVALRPQDPRALTALGQVQEQLGEISGAIRTFRTVLALDPNSSDAHVNLGIAFGDQGDQAALNESAKAIELAPKSANAHFLRGRPLDDLGSKEKARGEFRAVLEISPKFVEALHFLALLESDDGNVSEAADLLRQYLRLRPRDAEAFCQYGKILKKQHRDSEAIVAWKRALAINSRYREVLYHLAHTLKQTDPAESARLFARLSKLQQDEQVLDRVKFLGNQANLKIYDADYRGAIGDLKEAIILCGTCELLWALEKNLGLAYCHQGQLEFGERALKSAELLKPDDPSVKEALEVVKRQREQALSTLR